MSAPASSAILIVANRTASTPALLVKIRERATAAEVPFGLMVPPEAAGEGSDWDVDEAKRLVEHAAGSAVDVEECGSDAAVTVHDLVESGKYGQIILSTTPAHHARWHRHDLPRRVQRLGVPVTVIPPELEKWGPVEGFPAEWVPHAVSPAGIAGLGNY